MPLRITQQLRAAYREHALAEEPHGFRAGKRRRAVAQSHVEAVALEILDARLCGDAHVDPGMRAREAREPRYQPQRGERMRRRDRQRLAAAGLRAQALSRGAHGSEHLRRGGVELLARHGERERAVPALEERRAELILELFDLAAHRRLREIELLARLGERQVARRRLEAYEQVERRKARQRSAACIPITHACPEYLPFEPYASRMHSTHAKRNHEPERKCHERHPGTLSQ